MGRLIVNADDFGLTAGVNRAIAELHQAGLVTSATLMARAAATEEAIEMARATPSLSVGCHVVLVDGESVLSVRHGNSHLRGPVDGRFHASLLAFLARVHEDHLHRWPGRRGAGKEIEAETAAQIALLQSGGLHLTHIDTHKHVHMFPTILRAVLRAAKAAGIRAVRNPFEPAWSVRATPSAPLLRRVQVSLLRRLEPTFLRVVAEEGFTTTAGALGVLATGRLDAESVASLLAALPEGTYELVTHPGYNDADLAQAHTHLLVSREAEQEALRILREFPAIEPVSFADLDPGAVPAQRC